RSDASSSDSPSLSYPELTSFSPVKHGNLRKCHGDMNAEGLAVAMSLLNYSFVNSSAERAAELKRKTAHELIAKVISLHVDTVNLPPGSA
ncbi:STE20-related kinase adapter protein alpha, partial [Bienertia sinuspersici]